MEAGQLFPVASTGMSSYLSKLMPVLVPLNNSLTPIHGYKMSTLQEIDIIPLHTFISWLYFNPLFLCHVSHCKNILIICNCGIFKLTIGESTRGIRIIAVEWTRLRGSSSAIASIAAAAMVTVVSVKATVTVTALAGIKGVVAIVALFICRRGRERVVITIPVSSSVISYTIHTA